MCTTTLGLLENATTTTKTTTTTTIEWCVLTNIDCDTTKTTMVRMD
jgi:hypothetical protein